MKPVICFFAGIFIYNSSLYAQSEETRVKAGEDISAVISEYGKFRFPDFRQGRIFYLYGKSATALFNYNYLIEEMQYINPAGKDTLALANADQVMLIRFDSTFFYYDEGFMEIIKDYDSVSIAMKQKITIKFEKIGAYGQPNTTSAIDNRINYTEGSMSYNLTVNQDAVIQKEITWYLITDNNRPVKADKAGFKKMYPRHGADINRFMKINKDGLRTLENIKQLLVTCLLN